MAKLRLTVTLEYDPELWHPTEEERQWFHEHVLGDELILHSNLVGDSIGAIRVVEIHEPEDGVMKLTLSIYRNRAASPHNKTAVIGPKGAGHAHRLCGVELLPGDPLIAEVDFPLRQILAAIPGLKYEPPEED